jgi:hypothetical protein
MNTQKLKDAEKTFLKIYPLGFNSPEMIEIGKKHKMDKLVQFAHESFSPSALENANETAENMIKLVSRSSMVSVFEKPKFRDAIRAMTHDEKGDLADSLSDLLHGDEAKGFHQMLDILTKYSLAKWTLITVFRCYYYPKTDLLFKPTTVKNVITYFELEGLKYKPRPSYDFFVEYRNAITDMKSMVSELLSPSFAAFSGFLMMTMEMK